MGKKEKKNKGVDGDGGAGGRRKQAELLKTLGDFTSKENWDQFFTIRGSDDSFEWYAEWQQLQNLLPTHLMSSLLGSEKTRIAAADVKILVPGCGNSRLSEHLYDSGFVNITNVDFSTVVISDMLRKNVRERPWMKWRVMDITDMQFVNDAFDAIVDKGGLDALMEPKLGPGLGIKYLSEVKRLLKAGGRYVCLTLAESHVLDILFTKFRFGWDINIHAISQDSSPGSVNLHTFMFVAVKVASTCVSKISLDLGNFCAKSPGDQVSQLHEALKREEKLRENHSSGSDILYSLEDLNIGVKGNLAEIEPGRRIMLVLGEHGVSRSLYNAVLLDAPSDLAPFSYRFGVFLVPKVRAKEWLFSSEEGQWVIVENSKAARLVMILLDSSNSDASMEDIQKDLSPLVRQLAPSDCTDGVQIPFMAASDGIKQREIVHEVKSSLTGPIVVDDVIYENVDDDLTRHFPSKDLIFRRLTFQRSENLVQSEALISIQEPTGIADGVDNTKAPSASKTRKKGRQKVDSRKFGSRDLVNVKKVDHTFLASAYHNGIIAGVMLFSEALKKSATDCSTMRAVIIGLGAGLLPMFMRNCFLNMNIEVIELDPVVLVVAKEYFGFKEDGFLTAHITDGVKFVRDEAALPETEGNNLRKVSLLIVDVDSSDSSSSLSCPAAEFVDESFLSSARDSLSDHGCLIMNLVSRSSSVKKDVCSRLKTVFGKSSSLFHLQLGEDLNEVIFVVKTNIIDENQLREAQKVLTASLEDEKHKWCQRIIHTSNLIKPLKEC